MTTKPITLSQYQLKLTWNTCTIVGQVNVANLAFEKNVIFRYTLDQWQTSVDVPAQYVLTKPVEQVQGMLPGKTSYAKGKTETVDVFDFKAVIKDEDLEYKHLGYIEFCLVYNCAGQVFVENNDGKFYSYRFSMLKGTDYCPMQVSMLVIDPINRSMYGTMRVYKKMALQERTTMRFTCNNWKTNVDVPADLFLNTFDRAHYAFKLNSTDICTKAAVKKYNEFRYRARRVTSFRRFPADFFDDPHTVVDDDENTDKTDHREFAFQYNDLDEELELDLADKEYREEILATVVQPEVVEKERETQPDVKESTNINMLEFACCYHADDREFWDNNNGHNYGYMQDPEKPPKVIKKLKPVEEVEESSKISDEKSTDELGLAA